MICNRNFLQKRIQRKKKPAQNFTTFQSKDEKVPVSRKLIGIGFSIDFAVMSVPLGYRKTPLSNRIESSNRSAASEVCKKQFSAEVVVFSKRK